jgi:hypothetical protein
MAGHYLKNLPKAQFMAGLNVMVLEMSLLLPLFCRE